MAGQLLETAGRSLMQKRTTDEASTAAASKGPGLSFGLVSSKISFGLYEGHLPVDHSSYTKSSDDGESDSDRNDSTTTSASARAPVEVISRPVSALGSGPVQVLGGASTKKVFSNWGGEFFKKNLDYRANTNKILEKMNLTLTGGNVAPEAKTSNGNSAGSDRFKSSLMSSGGTRMGGTFGTGLTASSASAKRTSVDSISSNEASPAKKLFNSYV